MTRQVIPYAIVVLFGYIGFALPLPILPQMFLDPVQSIVPHLSLQEKMIMLGFLMASFPLGQFFGAPILGRLSDQVGRKKIILYSLGGTTLGYLITAFSAHSAAPWGMFLGMGFCGFCEGNVTIGQSVIADISDEPSHKARNFGILNACIAVGFIIGPLMGGQLADPSVVSWFTFATPFWMAACMTVLGMGVIYFYSKETLLHKPRGEWHFFTAIWKGFQTPKLPRLYIANFFLALGYFSFFRFLPVLLEQRFNFSPSSLSFVMVYGSLVMMISVLIFVPIMAKRLGSYRSLTLFSLLLALSIALCAFPQTAYALWFTVPLAGICLSVTITNGSLLISNTASRDFQGQALGTLSSVQVLAEAITGFLGGLTAAKTDSLPLYTGAIMSLICCIILFQAKHRNHHA